ncbi:MAG: hypothetical protein GX639_05735 [Fibrobacter sp.]|nr:hypothetical protein [Fibrobacter sp.]
MIIKQQLRSISFFTVSRLCVLAIISFLMHTGYSQNARLDALANNFCIDDASAITNNPAASITYYDILQATSFADGTFGPFIGVKSLGKHLSVGLIANVNDHGDSVFYQSSSQYLDSAIDTSSELLSMFPAYPQLIIAANCKYFNFGLKVFYKRSDLEIQQSSSDNQSNEHIKKDIMIYGVSGSAGARFGIFGLYPFFTLSVPKTQGVATATGKQSFKASTENNIIAEAGTEFDFDYNGLNLRLGGIYSLTKYSFISNSTNKGGNPVANKTRITGYLGMTVYPAESVLLSAAYALISDNDNTEYAFDLYTMQQKNIGLLHYITASCEYEMSIKKINASLFIRSGVYWTLSNSTYDEHVEFITEPSRVSDYKEIYASDASSFIPTLGLGFSKGIIQFDIASKLAGWSGLVSGMPVLIGTLTLDFTKKVAKSTIERPVTPTDLYN